MGNTKIWFTFCLAQVHFVISLFCQGIRLRSAYAQRTFQLQQEQQFEEGQEDVPEKE